VQQRVTKMSNVIKFKNVNCKAHSDLTEKQRTIAMKERRAASLRVNFATYTDFSDIYDAAFDERDYDAEMQRLVRDF